MHLNPRKIFESAQASVIIAAIIAASLIWSTIKTVQKNYQLQAEVDNLVEEIEILELENENLRLGIEYFKTDTYLELEARQKFNKAGNGESVLLLPRDGEGSQPDENTAQDQDSELSNFQQWLYFLFGRDTD
jgi:cell division protein FtsB